MGYFPAETSNATCSGCAMCALMCPDVAIKVYRERAVTVEAEKPAKSVSSKKDTGVSG